MLPDSPHVTAALVPARAPARWQLWLVLALVVLGALIRIAGMQQLSFYGDEETTAFAASSVLTTGKPAVPSGMDYNRAPLYSYMAAASAALFGESREFSYRLPALIFGVLSIWWLWSGTRKLLGVAVALLATALLAGSEWHALTSSYARMYSPYVAFFMCTAYFFLQWNRKRAPLMLVLGTILYLLSASFQILSVFALLLLLLPHFVARVFNARQFWIDTGLAVLLAALAIYLDGALVQVAYSDFATAVAGGTKSTALSNVALFWIPMLQSALAGSMLWVVAAALLASSYAMWRWLPWGTLPWNLAVAALGLIATLFMALGQTFALAISLYLLVVLATARDIPLVRCLLLAGAAMAVGLGASLFTQRNGWMDHLTNPDVQLVFPYLAQLLAKYPLVVGPALLAPLFANHRFGSVAALDSGQDEQARANLVRTLALFFVLNLLAFGVFGQWYEDRYIVHTYPFMLVLAAFTLVVALDALAGLVPWLQDRLWLPVAAGILGLSLLTPHHLLQGAWQGATRTHGDTNIENRRYFPDHASVGSYVRERLQPGDVVVATDVLQQRWYVGQADYWLRSHSDTSIYVYEDKNDGRIRDIYVNAELLNGDHARQLLSGNQRVWVIVSSIDVDEEWAISAPEQEFLRAVRAEGPPRLTGRDGRSAVYLVGGDA